MVIELNPHVDTVPLKPVKFKLLKFVKLGVVIMSLPAVILTVLELAKLGEPVDIVLVPTLPL